MRIKGEDEFLISVSGIVIGIRSKYPYVRNYCREYEVFGEDALFWVSASRSDIEKEYGNTDDSYSLGYAEAICLYREIAEKLPIYSRVLFHGAAMEYGGRCIIFSGRSGVGKTTHTELLERLCGGRMRYINGDKPILHYENGLISACGTPFAGKEGHQNDIKAPVCGICYIEQAKQNSIEKLTYAESFRRTACQIYMPYDSKCAEKTLMIADALCALPCYLLRCDISEDAARLSMKTLFGGEI